MTTQHVSTPASEIEITAELIQSLLRCQTPTLADLQLQHAADGWDNSIWRLGHEFAVRLPRRQAAVESLRNEQQWLPVLSPTIPVPVPTLRFLGEPTNEYPWPWSVVDWLPGTPAAQSPIPASEAGRLAHILRSIHVTAPAAAPRNPYRGVALVTREELFQRRLDRLFGTHRPVLSTLDIAPAPLVIESRASFENFFSAAAATRWEQQPLWLHGDIHPRNLLVANNRISALIDWGDVCAGDPASDLACLWMLLPRSAHQNFKEAYGRQDDLELWQRARGWAIQFGVLLLVSGLEDSDRDFRIAGAITLHRALADVSTETCG